jgi:DNA repair protein RecO (recombination protein O)
MKENQAYLLHRRPYRDTSILCVFFSEAHGQVHAIAQSGRKRSGWQLALHPYIPLWLKWKGEDGLVRLTHCEQSGPGINLTGPRLYCGFYLNELMIKMSTGITESTSLFALYQHTIFELAQSSIPETLRHFEKGLLERMGYGLAPPVQVHDWYQYFADRGFVASHEHPAAFSKQHVEAIFAEDWSVPGSLESAKRLYRQAIDQHLPSPLKSRLFFQGVNA